MRFRVRVSHPPSHVTLWSCDHVICKKAFIFTFARAQFFTIQGSFLLIYRQKLKSGKVTSSFSKWTNLWKKIFISRYEMIMFIYKSWSVNSSLMTLFDPSKVTRGDSFAFKILLTIISWQEQRFLQVHCWFLKKIVKTSILFWRAKLYYHHNQLYQQKIC